MFKLTMFPLIRLCLVAFALTGTAWVIGSSSAMAQEDELYPCFVECHDAAMEAWESGEDWDDVNEDFLECNEDC